MKGIPLIMPLKLRTTRPHLLILLFAFSIQSYAQVAFFKSLKAETINLTFSSKEAHLRDPGFNQIQNSARFGHLLEPMTSYEWSGLLMSNSFDISIDFKFKKPEKIRHGFVAGIRKTNQKINWNQNINHSLTGRSEWMDFYVGYQYHVLKRKWIRFKIGTQLDYGFTISSSTREVYEFEAYKYFGHPGHHLTINFPFLLDIRVFKGVLITLGPGFGAGYFSQDGIGQTSGFSSFTFGLRFHI